MFDFNISIVIPVMNEQNSIAKLVEEVTCTLKGKVRDIEFVFINDASTDQTEEKLKELEHSNYNVIYSTNEENLGQGASLLKGMKMASHSLIVTMDGDLQIDPIDIEKLIYVKVFNSLDFVTSRRKKRAGAKFINNVPSILGNILISSIFNTDFTDIGSSLKIVQKKDIQDLESFRNIHRYLGIILASKGLRYEEIPVLDRHRQFGESKYSVMKFVKVLSEITYLKRYIQKSRDTKCVA